MKGLSFIVLVALWGIALSPSQNPENNAQTLKPINSGNELGKSYFAKIQNHALDAFWQ